MFHKYLVEFLGTMILSFIIFATESYLAIGAALAIIIFLGGHISAGAFNPAIALALYHSGKIMQKDIIPYIIIEFLGALSGYEVYKRFVDKK